MPENRGFVEPEDGTEAFELFLKTEGCSVTACRVEAADPLEAADLAEGAEWCPGWCADLAAATRENPA